MKRGYPRGGEVRKSPKVGPSYPEERFRIPFEGSEKDAYFGNETSKRVYSPAGSTFEPPLGIHDGYEKLWEGK
jgi:hypothetical protein